MKIVISDDCQDAVGTLRCFDLLARHRVVIHNDTVGDTSELIERFRQADALVLIRERTRVTRDLLAGLPRLKLISQTGRIGAHIDIDACTEAGVAVAEGVGSPIAPAELTWALILASRRQLCRAADDMRRGRWQTTFGQALSGQTLGIWGYGKIGRIIASYGRVFGMRVLVWGSAASRAAARDDGFDAADSRAAFFTDSDVLTLHLRLSPDTRGIVALEDLRRMKASALFVNTSRAELIEPGALERALQEGRPGFVAVDVYENEPLLDPEHPLCRTERALCTPHIGYVEKETYEIYFDAAFRNVNAFFAGGPANLVNPAVLSRRS